MPFSISDKVLNSLSNVQEKKIVTREQLKQIRSYFFQFIGVTIIGYVLAPIPISIYVLLKTLLSIMFSLPIRIIYYFLPQTTNSQILLLIFSLCLLASFYLAKYSSNLFGQSYSFKLKFTFALCLQIIFILLPIAFIAHDRKLIKIDNDHRIDLFGINKTDQLPWHENQTKIIDIDNRYNRRNQSTYSISFYFINDILQNYFLSSNKHSSQSNSTYLLNAFTDLHCYDYTQMKLKTHADFLNIYRRQSPFPIYLSILHFNGPICHQLYSNTTCTIQSKRILPHLLRQLYRFIRFWLIISIPLIIIYKYLSKQRQKPLLSSNSQSEIDESLDKNLQAQFSTWLTQEQNNGYQRLSETIRRSLNTTLIKQYERLKIETLQFAHANIHHVSQQTRETIIIRAVLDIDHLIFNVIKNDYFSIKIPKLSGDLEIHLIDSTIEVKFTQLHMTNAEIIDIKNILLSNEKESIIKLLKDVIYQTVVQYCFCLSEIEEKTSIPMISESKQQPIVTNMPIETPRYTPIVIDTPKQIKRENKIKQLLIRIVKAVQLHNVEQPYCIVELNNPKQTHQTSLAKNGLNPFWDERFTFECNEKSNLIRLQIFDRKKPTRKHPTSINTIYADVTIPFSYATSTVYKQDVRITPQYPESIIRIEFSTLTDEELAIVDHADDLTSISTSPTLSIPAQKSNKIEHDSRQSPSDEILTLACNENGLPEDYQFIRNNCQYASIRSQPLTITTFSTSVDTDNQSNKPRKSRSFMNSFRLFSRRKKNKTNTNDLTSTNIPHSFSAEPFLSPTLTEPSTIQQQKSVSRSFRNIFRSNSKRQPINTNNFIFDHPESLSNSTPKKRSFFRRFRSKRKRTPRVSANSLTSDDCTRTESVRNTPIRANVGRPVTMTN